VRRRELANGERRREYESDESESDEKNADHAAENDGEPRSCEARCSAGGHQR
jgi:hypothetical protein